MLRGIWGNIRKKAIIYQGTRPVITCGSVGLHYIWVRNVGDEYNYALIPRGSAWPVTLNCVTKMDTFLGLFGINSCAFLNPLQIFIPCVEILFFINQYFPLSIFKYRTSLRKFH